jgi:hypothetical protein
MSKPTSLDFMQAVYLNESLPLNTRLRAAIEAAPYEHAKQPTALALGYWNNESFAAQLDRAIERSQRPVLLIEGKAELVVQHPADELKRPFARPRGRRV